MKLSFKSIILTAAFVSTTALANYNPFGNPNYLEQMSGLLGAGYDLDIASRAEYDQVVDDISASVIIPSEGASRHLAQEVWNKTWPVINNAFRDPDTNAHLAFNLLNDVNAEVNNHGLWMCATGFGPMTLAGHYSFLAVDTIGVSSVSSVCHAGSCTMQVKGIGDQGVTCGWLDTTLVN